MTQMAEALRAAGIPVKPLSERVWNIVRDQPNRTATHYARVVGGNEGSVSAALSMMVTRGMLEHGDREERARPGRGHGSRPVRTFRVARGMERYELLPDPRPVSKRVRKATDKAQLEAEVAMRNASRAPTTSAPAPAPEPPPAPAPVPMTFIDTLNIDSWTLSQAREVHAYLNKFFGA